MTFTVKLDPNGTLEMIDSRGGRHPFRRAGTDRWEAPLSEYAKGSVRREGDQLLFRREPGEKQPPPIKGKNGLMVARRIVPVEDRMTRVPDDTPAPGSAPGSK
jgi:hypothetical protein